jgi:hypothetical protein
VGGIAKYFGCKELGCNREHVSRGYCRMHYQENKLKGLFTDGEWKKCKEPECNTIAYAREMCKSHYAQWRYQNREKTKKQVNVGQKCAVEWCPERADTKLMCVRHYTQIRYYKKIFMTCMDQKYFTKVGKDDKGEYLSIPIIELKGEIRATVKIDCEDKEKVLALNWNISSSGYARSNGKDGKCKWMHRLILGLGETDGKVVDHINHDKLDNRKKNLQLVYIGANAAKQKKRRKIEYSSKKRKWRARVIFYGPYRSSEVEAHADFIHLEKERWERKTLGTEINQKSEYPIKYPEFQPMPKLPGKSLL